MDESVVIGTFVWGANAGAVDLCHKDSHWRVGQVTFPFKAQRLS